MSIDIVFMHYQSSSPSLDRLLHCRAQDWCLLRVWDAMEFEEEHNESVNLSFEAQGGLDAAQTKVLTHLGI